ncbi:MAG: hypothetical protein J0I47_03005 [Sphingomonas sp.]|uniref:hypothetical protein n=1 Tax=Sphingomonas sp. TaxID=28214 RepID=UPI001ACA96F4|nr:hypothetical protein [Sphingomonas sp.]MBN8807195.1 hypothetical protein [Sphingomonas sp.]
MIRQRELGTVLLVIGLAMLGVAIARSVLWHTSVGRSIVIASLFVGLGFAVRRGLLAKTEARR